MTISGEGTTDRASAEKATSGYLNLATDRLEKREQFIRSHIEGLRADGWNEDFLREEERLMRSNMHASAVVDHILSNIGLR